MTSLTTCFLPHHTSLYPLSHSQISIAITWANTVWSIPSKMMANTKIKAVINQNCRSGTQTHTFNMVFTSSLVSLVNTLWKDHLLHEFLTNAEIRWELLLLFGNSKPICHQIRHPCFSVDVDFFVNWSPCSQAQSSTDSSPFSRGNKWTTWFCVFEWL